MHIRALERHSNVEAGVLRHEETNKLRSGSARKGFHDLLMLDEESLLATSGHFELVRLCSA